MVRTSGTTRGVCWCLHEQRAHTPQVVNGLWTTFCEHPFCECEEYAEQPERHPVEFKWPWAPGVKIRLVPSLWTCVWMIVIGLLTLVVAALVFAVQLVIDTLRNEDDIEDEDDHESRCTNCGVVLR